MTNFLIADTFTDSLARLTSQGIPPAAAALLEGRTSRRL